MKIRSLHIVSIIGIVLLVFVSSCSTKKNKWNRRIYHNITAHYNAYFNGNEALKDAIKNIETNNVDDFTEVLNVYPLGTTQTIMSASSNLDRSIKKASLVIHKHSMYFRKKEEVKWVYYSYLMMGKSKFYKQEYGMSKQILGYIISRYPKEKIKQEAILWVALNESVLGNYDNAISQLDGIKAKVNSKEIGKEAYRMLPKVYSDVYVRAGNYSAAIPYLKEAIKRAKRKEKSRLYFILAQLEQRQKKLKDATQHYLAVLKRNPTYEMDFNARINMAKSFERGDAKVVMKKLRKMLKDIKNEQYKDQIYYVMAEVALKQKHKAEAVGYLKESVKTSVSNNKQKAFSALMLAEIYFDEEKYLSAQSYYDSTMLFLPKNYPDYQKLDYRNKVLTELVNNLLIVQTEDSLQQLANMSERKRNKLIDGYIQAVIAEEQREAEEERLRQEQLQFMAENRQTDPRNMQSVTQRGKAKWYFYNTTAVANGMVEFQAKWGRRKLADNWRISDKQIFDFDDEGGENSDNSSDSTTTSSTSKALSTNKKSREYYLQNVPFTEAQMDSSNARIEIALFNAASIYKDKLMNNQKAIATFDELLRRFPDGKNTAHTYYNFYRMYDVDGNKGDARYYKNKLIKEFPKSEYAKMLLNPNYFENMRKEADKVKRFYKSTYLLYSAGKYDETKKNCAKAKVDFPENELQLSKFAFLNALSIGHSRDTAAFITALQIVVDNFAEFDVKPKAEEMIALLKLKSEKHEKKSRGEKDQEDGNSADGSKAQGFEKAFAPSIYSYDTEVTYMFLVLADKRNVKISELKNKISDHDRMYFGTENLTVSAIPINQNILLVAVSNFPNEKKAKEYYKTVKRNKLLYALIKKNGGDYFIISEGNYSRLYRSKDIDAYRKFASEHYPKGK